MFVLYVSVLSSKEETTKIDPFFGPKIDPFFGPEMGLFFFVWFHASISSPGEEKPLKNDFRAKQTYTKTGDRHPVGGSRKSWTAPGLILISPDLPTIFYPSTVCLWAGRTGELIQQLAGSSAVHQASFF